MGPVPHMRMMAGLLDTFGRLIARRLNRPQPLPDARRIDVGLLRRVMEPGDVLLVETNNKVSSVIRYLTQSTWSHAALYVGGALGPSKDGGPDKTLIEVNLEDGCVGVPLEMYAGMNVRICRPVGLTPEDRGAVVQFMIDHLGIQYDLKNITDMLRYFFPAPPVPGRCRRRMIAFGSGEPTRAICSTLIAKAFQSVRYPILPKVGRLAQQSPSRNTYTRRDILMIRHHSLYTPKDFDVSPYFAVIKPTLQLGFDYKSLVWHEDLPPPLQEVVETSEVAETV